MMTKEQLDAMAVAIVRQRLDLDKTENLGTRELIQLCAERFRYSERNQLCAERFRYSERNHRAKYDRLRQTYLDEIALGNTALDEPVKKLMGACADALIAAGLDEKIAVICENWLSNPEGPS